MEITCIKAVYFSATGNTRRVTEAVAEEIAKRLGTEMEVCDFTLPKARQQVVEFTQNELAVFGMPVYAGRVPNKMLPVVQTMFRGNDTLAIPLVTFGNRSYDNALIELRNELEKNGFHTIAGAALAARHAFSDRLAGERPGEEDFRQLSEFAQNAAEKVTELAAQFPGGEGKMTWPKPVAVKGIEPIPAYYTPLGEDGQPAKFLKAKPKTRENCTDCKICAKVCPMGSIGYDDPSDVTGICIKCQACVRSCPVDAKYFDDPAFLSHVAMLEKNYTRRAENDFFYGISPSESVLQK